MFIKIKNVKKIGINEASYIYKVLCRRRNKIKKKEIISNKNNKLLFLTALFERDILAFEICNLQTAYLIGRGFCSLNENIEFSDASAISQQLIRPTPPPKAAPLITASVGYFKLLSF